jgi:simple sugar transport system substrate-binding protein
MMKRRLLTIAAAVTAAVLAAGSASAQKAKIGVIYPSPIGDLGWSHEIDVGRQAIADQLGDKVEFIKAENIPEGPDAQRVMNQMASENPKLIILGSFGYMNDGLRLASTRPDIAFIHASGYKTTKNFGWFLARNYQSAYAAGIAAGYVTKNKILGVVAAYPIPEVLAMINGLTLGAQKVNPEVTVKVVWLNSWFDPNKSQEAARSLVAQKADVLYSLYQDTPEVVSLAEQLGVYVISTSSDMSRHAPKWYLAGPHVNWSNYFVASAEAAIAGTFKGDGYWGGMQDGCVSVVAISRNLTPEQRKTVDDAIAAMTAGTFHPMTGPITSQDGELKLKPGEAMADGPLLGINWLVKGVETRIPK